MPGNGQRIRVIAEHGHVAVAGLAGRVLDEAAAVEQHQRVADAQVAQIDRIDVAARGVARLRIVGFVEGDVARLRDRSDQIVARLGPRRVDLVANRSPSPAARR
jgi:hypothetical protein